LDHDVLGLFTFIREAIEGREYAKFVFSKSLSDAFRLLGDFGEDIGISKDDLAYLNVTALMKLYADSSEPRGILLKSIEYGRESYDVTKHLVLPPLINEPDDVFAFQLPDNIPNYVTLKSVKGQVVNDVTSLNGLTGAILMLPSADPGYDWIFSHRIAGFITMYGGANSHMAIRSCELGIPAVVGAGETLFRKWSQARTLQLDCANRQVAVIQ
jgi:phosphohistidine swiveling domain-containing protein